MEDEGAIKRTGDVVAGRYRIEALVGRGGFGVVFRATDLPGDRPVALKMMLSEALAAQEGLARFQREAELAKSLEHPNTVRLFDFGKSEEGLPFIAWEFLEGKPLDAVLAIETRLAPDRVARLALQTLSALKEAHGLGIIHRDIKPSNIFLCEVDGQKDFVKLIDFGIAKDTKSGQALTRMGAILGTPSYMAPEQVAGKRVTPATDLYSLGLVMAEALTGEVVFTGETGFEVCLAQIAPAPAPLSAEVRMSPLGPVIARATEKTPGARLASAGDMMEALEAAEKLLEERGAETMRASTEPSSRGEAFASTVESVPNHPLFAGDAAPAVVVSAPQPPPAVSPTLGSPTALAAPAPAKAKGGSRGLKVAALVFGGLVVAGGVTVAVLFAAGVIGASPRPIVKVTAPAHPGVLLGRRFAGLTNKVLRARIEAAGHKVTGEVDREGRTSFALGGDKKAVDIYRLADAATAEATEATLVKAGGATARDGNVLLHVSLLQPAAAHELLDKITK